MSKGYSMAKVKAFDGMQGRGYSAFLMRDGHAVAEVRDEGRGGAVFFRWLDRENRAIVRNVDHNDQPREYGGTAEEAAFIAHCLSLPSINLYGTEMRQGPDIVADRLVTEFEVEKRLKRILKTKIVFIVDGNPLSAPVKAGFTHEQTIAAIKQHYPSATFLNTLSIAEAVQLATAAGM
ncbi:hypothetical protein P9281_34930 [Caballeronia sp. LP003]|uniref:hypothetical protein n=1 Tax=Caballeronia sp. LP003 TaxID=3038551 RepID=UPI0028632732|nr:hypothetical protein [Caballeronia sp. LP003]MDR5791745.1 hypothetical protein [Caballeronia sp. LP003]